jgi:hypothetical protein
MQVYKVSSYWNVGYTKRAQEIEDQKNNHNHTQHNLEWRRHWYVVLDEVERHAENYDNEDEGNHLVSGLSRPDFGSAGVGFGIPSLGGSGSS